ncbi:protein PF3D7_1417600-like isoform X1 [Mytilus edulis]|uniref:protein PF3D7_1417600-like isoform X1 n=1 Tax=Mytilus edulis TaxID=6550 RepID=UPI0039F0B49B
MGQITKSFASLVICILLVFFGNVQLGESRVLGRQLLSTDSDETFDMHNKLDKTIKITNVSPNETPSYKSAANSHNTQSEYSNYLTIGAADNKNKNIMEDMLNNVIDKIIKETIDNITNLRHVNQMKSEIQNYGTGTQQVIKMKDPSILQNNAKPTVDERWNEFKNANNEQFSPRGNMNLQFRDENTRMKTKNDDVIRTIYNGNENKKDYNRMTSDGHKNGLVNTIPHITRPNNWKVFKTAGGKQLIDDTPLIGKSVDMTGIRNDNLNGRSSKQNTKLEAYSRKQIESFGKQLQNQMHESYNSNTNPSRTFQEGRNQNVLRGSFNTETTFNENINIKANGKLSNKNTTGINVERELGIIQQAGANNSKVNNLEKSMVSKNHISNNTNYEYMRAEQNTINEENTSTIEENKKNISSLNEWVTKTIKSALNNYKNASFTNNLLDKQEFLTRMENIKKELLKKMLTKSEASSTTQLHLTELRAQQNKTTNNKKGVAKKRKQKSYKKNKKTKFTKGNFNSIKNFLFSLGNDKKSTKPRYNKIVSPSGKEEVFVYEVVEVVHHGNASEQATEIINTTKSISLSKPTTNSSNSEIKAKNNIPKNNMKSAKRNRKAKKTKSDSKSTNSNRSLIKKIKQGMMSKGSDIGNLVQKKRKTEKRTKTEASQDKPITRSSTASNRKKPSQINTIKQTIKTKVNPGLISISIPGINQSTYAQIPSNSKNGVNKPSSSSNNKNIDVSLNNQMTENIESSKNKMNDRKKDDNSTPTTQLTGKIPLANPLTESPLTPRSRFMTHLDEAKILAIRKHLVRMLQQINGHIAATRTKNIELIKQQNEINLLDRQKEKNILEQTLSGNIVKNSETTENKANERHIVTESLTGAEPGIHKTNQIKSSKPTTLGTDGKPTVNSITNQNLISKEEAVLSKLPNEKRNLKPQDVLPNIRSNNIILKEIRPSYFKPAFNNFIDVEFLNPGETLHRINVSEISEKVKNQNNVATSEAPADRNLKQPPLGTQTSDVKESSSASINQTNTLQSNIIDNSKHTNMNSQKKMLTKNLQALLKMSDMLLAKQSKMQHGKLLPGAFNEPLNHNQENMNGFMQNELNIHQPNTNNMNGILNEATNNSPQGQTDVPKSAQSSNHSDLSSVHKSQSSWNLPRITTPPSLRKLEMPFGVENRNNHNIPQNMLESNRMQSNFRNQVFAENPLPDLNQAIIQHMKDKSRNTLHVGLPENQSDRHLLGNALMLDHVNNYFRNKFDHIKGSDHHPNINTVNSQNKQNGIHSSMLSNVKQNTVQNSVGGTLFPVHDHSSLSDQKLTDFKNKMFSAQAGRTSHGAAHLSGRNIQKKWVTDNKYNDITPNFPAKNNRNGMFFRNDRIFNVGPQSSGMFQNGIGSQMKTETPNMQPNNMIDLQFLNPGSHTSAVHKPIENGTTGMASNSVSLTNPNISSNSEFVAYNHLQRMLDNWSTPSPSYPNEHGNHRTTQRTVSKQFHNSYHNLVPSWNSKWPAAQVPESKRLPQVNQISQNLQQTSPIQSQIPQNQQQLSKNNHQSSPNADQNLSFQNQISPNRNQISQNQQHSLPSVHQPSNSNSMINNLPTQRTRITKQSSVHHLIPKVSLQFSSNRPVKLTGNVLPKESGTTSPYNWNSNTNQNTNNVHSFQSRGGLNNPSISGHVTENKMTRSGKDVAGNVWFNHKKLLNSFIPESTIASNSILNGADAASQILNSVFSNNIHSQSSSLRKDMLKPITNKKWYSYILNV